MIRRPYGLEYALLGFLEQEPQHGYQLHQRISDSSQLGLIWRVKQSQLYALLVKLESSGHVTSSLISQETHPPRKIFILTEKGRAAYHAWLTNPVTRPRQMRQEFMAKLFFASQEGWESVRMLIDQQLKVCREWLTALDNSKPPSSKESDFSMHVLKYRTGQVKAALEWLEGLMPEADKQIL